MTFAESNMTEIDEISSKLALSTADKHIKLQLLLPGI